MGVGKCTQCGSFKEVEFRTPWWAWALGPFGFILFGSLRCADCKRNARR